jgi:ubiquinone/menaquinone biosynthesis C-methylase UbiE
VPTPETDVTEFSDVDQSDQPETLIGCLEVAKALPGWIYAKRDGLAALGLHLDDVVLDTGCGYGADAVEIARHVGPNGAVIGLDLSEAMISEANRRTERLGVNVEFRVGDARDLPFPDATFDACRAETLLQHVSEPHVALGEMVRVVKPGGRIVVLDMDLGTSVIDSDDRPTTTQVLRFLAGSTVNGWIGRQLPRLLKDAGLEGVASVAHFIESDYLFIERMLRSTSTEALHSGRLPDLTLSGLSSWWSDLGERDRAGRFFGGATAFIAWGTKRHSPLISEAVRGQEVWQRPVISSF